MSSELLEEQNLKIMLALLCEDKYDMLAEAAELMAAKAVTDLENRLAEIFSAWSVKDNLKAVELFYLLSQNQYLFEDNDCRNLLLPFWIRSQLLIPHRSNPSYKQIFKNYRANLRVLKKIDPDLTKEIESSKMPENLVIIYTWNGLTAYDYRKNALLDCSEAEFSQLDVVCNQIQNIGFAGVQKCKHIAYCLSKQYKGLYGMTRLHYVFEEDISQLRLFLSLYDFSSYLTTNELKIFGGAEWYNHLYEFVRDGYYLLPNSLVADVDGKYDSKVGDIHDKIFNECESVKEEVYSYYKSEEFKSRQQKIAKGELMPRILVITCRWTTFLKYAAKDFQLAFEDVGCETKYLIEKDDVQSLSLMANFNEISGFKPDVCFSVSHARPSYSFFPKELPIISNIQDKCGKLSEIMDISEYYSEKDLYVCISPAHSEYVAQKNVPSAQIIIWPMPANERLFFPLGEEVSVPARYISDISFVKHCNGWHEDVMSEFIQSIQNDIKISEDGRNYLSRFFNDVHEIGKKNGTKRIYEDEIIRQACHVFDVNVEKDKEKLHIINQFCHHYYVGPFSDLWRGLFIEALAENDFDLALYGNGWDKYPAVAKYARGGANRDTELNYVYNNTKVNLLISQAGTLHVRIAECGMANAFIMISDHDQSKDWGPAREYYEEGKEVVFFDDRKDLIEKTRYYLEHENERIEIATNLHKKVMATMSCKSVAKMILEKWRTLL